MGDSVLASLPRPLFLFQRRQLSRLRPLAGRYVPTAKLTRCQDKPPCKQSAGRLLPDGLDEPHSRACRCRKYFDTPEEAPAPMFSGRDAPPMPAAPPEEAPAVTPAAAAEAVTTK